jgi:hypothetical protein
MIYASKKECYDDILLSLELGIIEDQDIRHLLKFYQEMEFYECCQGVVDAFVTYTKNKNEHTESTTRGSE